MNVLLIYSSIWLTSSFSSVELVSQRQRNSSDPDQLILTVLVNSNAISPYGKDKSGLYLAGKDGALVFELERYLKAKFLYRVISKGSRMSTFRDKLCFIKSLRGVNIDKTIASTKYFILISNLKRIQFFWFQVGWLIVCLRTFYNDKNW